jgi:hypothetical protein
MIPCAWPPCDVNVPMPVATITETILAQADPSQSGDFDPVPDGDLVPIETAPEIESEDLGEIRILRPRAVQPDAVPPMAHLLLQTSAYASTNITGLDTPSDGGYPLGFGATLLLTPTLGPSTRLVASAGAGINRFPGDGNFNYDALDFSVGVQHQLNREMYGRIAWDNRQLYRAGSGENLSSTNAVNFTLGRQDRFSDDLRLDSYYILQGRFVSPNEFSRLTNSVGANLRYSFSPEVDGLVGYQLALEDYTQVVRFDTTHRLRAGLNYRPSSEFYVSSTASYFFGSSSDQDVSLDNLSIGFSVGFNVPLF